MKKKFVWGAIVLILLAIPLMAGKQDRMSDVELTRGDYVDMPEISAPSGNPTSNRGWLYVKDNSGTSDLYFEDDAGTVTELTATAGGGVTLDVAYNNGKTITLDDTALTMNMSHASNVGLQLSRSAGTGHVIDISNSGTGRDIDGTSSTWFFTKAGALEINSTLTLADDATITNASNVISLTENSEDLDIGFATNAIDFSTDTSATTWEMYDGVASTMQKTADGAADDWTFALAGAQDSSLVISSAGTGADALQVATSAGGMDITVSGSSAGDDLDLTSDSSININATENAASAITVTTNGGTSETIVVTNTQGTGDAAIDINGTAGGIDIDAAKSVAIGSSENTADAIQIAATAGGIDITATGAAAEDLDLVNTNGSTNISGGEAAADAVTIAAGAGGIDITSAATFDIDITATGGKILGVASEAAADQFKIDAQGTIAGDAINLETTDGGIMLNADGAANGDIELNSADDMIITSAGDTTITTTGTLSVAGSQLTNVLTPIEIEAGTTNTVTAAESGKTFANTASAGATTFTLPDAAAGLYYCFVDNSSTAADDLIIDCQSGVLIDRLHCQRVVNVCRGTNKSLPDLYRPGVTYVRAAACSNRKRLLCGKRKRSPYRHGYKIRCLRIQAQKPLNCSQRCGSVVAVKLHALGQKAYVFISILY